MHVPRLCCIAAALIAVTTLALHAGPAAAQQNVPRTFYDLHGRPAMTVAAPSTWRRGPAGNSAVITSPDGASAWWSADCSQPGQLWQWLASGHVLPSLSAPEQIGYGIWHHLCLDRFTARPQF